MHSQPLELPVDGSLELTRLFGADRTCENMVAIEHSVGFPGDGAESIAV
jgi:hypothetical protein